MSEPRDIQEYWYGLAPLRVFRYEGRLWCIADDIRDILETPTFHFWRGIPDENDKARLYGHFLGQEIEQDGLPIITIEAAVRVTARSTKNRSKDVLRWLLVEVLPNVNKRHDAWIGAYSSTIRCSVVTK